MAEYFGPWLPAAYFGGGYFGGESGGPEIANAAATLNGAASVSAAAIARVNAAATIAAAGTLTAAAADGQPEQQPQFGGGSGRWLSLYIRPGSRGSVYADAGALLSGTASVTAAATVTVRAEAVVSGRTTFAAKAVADRSFTATDNDCWMLAA